MSNSRFLPIAAAVVAALLGLAAASLLLAPQPSELQSGTLLPAPREIAELSLVDQDGRPFGKAALQDHWTVVFPGFTHCPDVCPATLATLNAVHKELAKQGKSLQVVFLSVDPQRDRPAQLASYVRYFNPAFVGVTADEPQLSHVAQTLMVTYVKVPGSSPDSYSMDHSAALVVINPKAQIAGFLTPPFQAQTMVSDLARLLEHGA